MTAIIGIYKFTNKVDGLTYIGQSVDIENRKKRHLRIVKNSVIPNNEDSYFHRALKKYGESGFTFSILETFSFEEIKNNKDLLNNAEKRWIKKLNTIIPNGYNSKSGGGQGVYYSNLLKQKMKTIQLKIQAKKVTHPTKSVICVETGIKYPSMKEAAKKCNILHSSTIGYCCRGKYRTAGGFHWCFPEDYSEKLLSALIEQDKKNREKPARAVMCIETGQIFRSASQAIKHNSIKYAGNIIECCKGQKQTAGGYHWKFTG